MAKGLQKTAIVLREKQLTHRGVLDPAGFNRHFETHCYEPSQDLVPFIEHTWTVRRKLCQNAKNE